MHQDNSTWESPITTLTTIPAPIALTGQITSEGKVVTGAGTDFLNEIEEGDFIFDSSQSEIRKVASISTRLEVLHLTEAFSADISSPINLVGVPKSNIEELSLENDGIGIGKINGVDFPVDQIITWKKNSRFKGQHGFIDPKVVDGTGTSINVSTLK